MPKRRYNNANEIRADIDKWKAKVQKLMDSASALDLRADQFIKGGPEFAEDVKWHRKEAERKRASALRIERRKLVHLKNKLSEWMTDPLPGTGVTKDVQA